MTTPDLPRLRRRIAAVGTVSVFAISAGCFVSESELEGTPCQTKADCGSDFYECVIGPEGAGTCEVYFGFAPTPPEDAGSEPVDAGTNPRDAGTMPMDAGMNPTDAGMMPMDAGIGIPDPTWPQVQAILTMRCAPCHTQATFQGNFQVNSTNSYTWIQEPASGSACTGQGTRVVAGNPDMSILWSKINGTPRCGQQMPPAAPLKQTQPADAQTIFNWISRGAKM